MYTFTGEIFELGRGAPALSSGGGRGTSLCPADDSPEEPSRPRFSTSNRFLGFSGPEEQIASSGETPPPNKAAPTQVFGEFPHRVFLRLPNGPGRELWPGGPLNYWKLRRLISPGPWNKNVPPVAAHQLCKSGADRGIVLIALDSLLMWLNDCFRRSGTFGNPIPIPKIELPPVLRIPPPGQECPYTSLRHTVMYELARVCSPHGQTGIYSTPYTLPGSAKRAIAIETQSLLRYIRSLPPPQYKIPPRSSCIFRKSRRPAN
jgi:hypothetical protein